MYNVFYLMYQLTPLKSLGTVEAAQIIQDWHPTSPGFHPTLSGSTRVSDQGGHDLSGGPHP